MANGESRAINVSSLTIAKVVIVLLLLWFLYLILDVLGIVFVSFIIAAAITPWVDALEARKIPRVASVIGIYVVLFGTISMAVALIVPAVVDELGQLAKRLPDLFQEISRWLAPVTGLPNREQAVSALQQNLDALNKGLIQVTSGIFNTLSSVFGGVASFITVLVIVFYMSVEQHGAKKFVQSFAPVKYRPYLIQLVAKIQMRLGGWLRGQLLLSLLIAVVTYIGLLLFGVKYALLLALLAGAFEIIPFIGPILAAIPAVFFAATDRPILALFVALFYLVVQQLENNILVPKVMQSSAGLNPIVILISVLIGARIGGIVGVIMAVPVAVILSVIFRDIFEERRIKDSRLETE